MIETINLPNLNEWKEKMDGICWRINKLRLGDHVTLNMTKIMFIKPQGTIMLLLICNRIWNITGAKVKITKINPAVQSYLERADFFNYSFVYTENKISLWNMFNRNTNSLSIIEITHIKSPNDSANLKRRVQSILETWFPDRISAQYCSRVSTMISEICNNSLEHSKGYTDMGECYFVLQRYTHAGKPEIVIAIGDIGVGIRHHLKFKYNWVSDSDVLCIKKILRGLSGRLDGSGGMGIPFIKSTISNYNGTFLIRSGKGYVEVKDHISSNEFQNSFPGTQSLIILD